MTALSLETLQAAADLVHQVLPPTPQICWPLLSARAGAEVWVKHENHHPAGAFKVRGGVSYVHRLRERHPDVQGLIAATRGNHGQSLAFSGARAALRVVVVVPRGNSVEKNAAMRGLGAELIEQGEDFQDALEYAERIAKDQGLHFVPSFDEALIAGVASYALELFSAVADVDTAYVPIGLGSGICGMIAVRDALGLKTDIVGVVASQAPAYALSFQARRPISAATTTKIADGMACRVPNGQALDIILKGAARIVTVTEEEIEAAIRHLFSSTHNVAEGAGAAALAGLFQESDRMRGRKTAVILTGGNVDRDVYARVLAAP